MEEEPSVYFGDLHNHCGISYGHGSLDDAIANAREQLDFVSITGHAHWPDMPPRDGEIDDIIDFHEKGFARLKSGWADMMTRLREADEPEAFTLFPAFEVHFTRDGDRNIFYRDLEGEILYPDNLQDLHRQLAALQDRGVETIAQPHHIGYRSGTRGINWETFDPRFAPFVEFISMHGCSENSEAARPFLHSMGPSDYESTIQRGLELGHEFGFTGGTDHHSAHPGSYGHGRLGVWARENTREALWKAFRQRHTFALTGDRIRLDVRLNGHRMGSRIPLTPQRHLEIDVQGGGAIDTVDILKNGRLVKRFSPDHFRPSAPAETVRTILHLELGWGRRNRPFSWEAEFGIGAGRILEVEPRFRGREVVSPLEGEGGSGFFESYVFSREERSVEFRTVTRGNPNNSTPSGQGVALHVEMPVDSPVWAVLNGRRTEWTLKELMRGARSGRLGEIDSPCWRFHRAPAPHELNWKLAWEDEDPQPANYYVRVRQTNDQWAWSSPVFVR